MHDNATLTDAVESYSGPLNSGTQVVPQCSGDLIFQIHLVRGDIVNKRTCQEIIDSTIEKFHSIHVLVNNAGGGPDATFLETSDELLDELLSINFKSVFTLTKLAVPHLIKTKGNYQGVRLISLYIPPHFISQTGGIWSNTSIFC